MDNEQKQLQVELQPEVAKGVYSNMAMVTHSASEFVLDFISMLPGMSKATVQSRVLMTPEHAKRLLLALQDNVARYEQNFGSIRLPETQAKGRTIAPFQMGKGEA